MTETPKTTATKETRGLTIFELLVIGAVVFGSIFWAVRVKSGMQNKIYDEQRKARASTLKENLMTLVNKNGSFPSDEQFQKDDTRKNLFATYLGEHGGDFLHDPQDKKLLITYIAEPEGCAPDTDNPCTKVTVAFRLSNGNQFIRFGIKPGKELEYLQKSAEDTNSTVQNPGPVE